uniref:phage tail protein n=1 Tax=uncultured Desulfovibrio sp. TaxID=167968 RepID=UPI0026290EA3
MAEDAPKYYAVLTDVGAALEARALAEGKGIVLTHIAVGDADLETVTPDPAVTRLVHEVHRRPIDARSRDENDPKVTLLHATIPADVGGFWINELGVVGHLEGDEEEVLYAYANHGRYYKMLPQDGQTITHELTIPVVQSTDARIVIEVADDGYATRLELLQLSGIVEDLRRNREAVWTLDAPVEEGGTLSLPEGLTYAPGGHLLDVFWEGV